MQQSPCGGVESSVLVVVIQSSGAAGHPNVIVRIHENTAHLAEHPIVRQLLGPVWIGFKLRRVLRERGKGKGEENDPGRNP